MAKKRGPKMPTTKASKMPKAKAAKAEDVPVRFMMPAEIYRRMEVQAKSVGASRSTYAKMKVIQGIKDDEQEGGGK